MKITDIKVQAVEVPLKEPFRISLGVITHAKSAIVTVETDEDVVGYGEGADRKSTRLNSSHMRISYAVFCLKKK